MFVYKFYLYFVYSRRTNILLGELNSAITYQNKTVAWENVSALTKSLGVVIAEKN